LCFPFLFFEGFPHALLYLSGGVFPSVCKGFSWIVNVFYGLDSYICTDMG
jgi:hypothetical protein